MPRTKPSEETEEYWFYAKPPIEKKVEATSFNWFTEKADGYKQSGKMYPRDIYREDLIEPNSETELTLHRIDIETINRVRRDGKKVWLLNGKWLIFVSREQIDNTWDTLSSIIESGDLPYLAKASTIKESSYASSDDHVICVYTPNYLYRPDVRDCRDKLKELGFEDTLYYKPDIFTYKKRYRVFGTKVNHRYYG